jgi:adenine-specific DNA-methyltransferase
LELGVALLPSLKQNIIVGNSLISPIDDANADDMFTIERYDALKAVDIHRTFPQVMQRGGGFDLVIGNPPYIKEYTNREAFDNVRESPYYQGKMDIWYMFACRALDILKPDTGTLAFIATNNWTTNFGAKRLRGKITTDARIEQLIDFGDFKVFRDAGIQTMILIAKRSKKSPSYVFDYRVLGGKNRTLADVKSLLARASIANSNYLKPEFTRSKFGVAPYTFPCSSAEAILQKINTASNFKLNDDEETRVGIDVHQDFVNRKSQAVLGSDFSIGQGIFNIYRGDEKILKLTAAEKRLLKPFFTTQELGRYWGNPVSKLWVIYTNSSFKDPASMKPYPNLKAHLDQFKEVITSDNKPYGLHRARDEQFFKGEKIISARKCGQPTFTYTDEDCYVSQTFNVIKTTRIDQQYLTALLNSKVIRYWLRHKGKMQGGQFQVDKEPLLAIPLLAPPKAEQKRIANLVDRILQASAKLQTVVLDSERDRYQRLIEQTDTSIQEGIFSLYKLSESDIDQINE